MAGSGAGYDLSTTTYSPDGRVYQIEYAEKAVETSGTAIALCCRDGVILATEKSLVSKMRLRGKSSPRNSSTTFWSPLPSPPTKPLPSALKKNWRPPCANRRYLIGRTALMPCQPVWTACSLQPPNSSNPRPSESPFHPPQSRTRRHWTHGSPNPVKPSPTH